MKNISQIKEQISPKTTSAPRSSRKTKLPLSAQRPEFIPLPTTGGDPVCGLSRSFWLDAEARGLVRLIRLRKPGRIRGRVLLPVQDAIDFVRSLGTKAQ